jgi:hypothetical protein
VAAKCVEERKTRYGAEMNGGEESGKFGTVRCTVEDGLERHGRTLMANTLDMEIMSKIEHEIGKILL